MDFFIALSIGLGAGFATLLASRLQPKPPQSKSCDEPRAPSDDSIVMLMRDGRMYNATDGARKLFADLPFETIGWDHLHKMLLPLFPDMPATEPDRTVSLSAPDLPQTTLVVQPEGDSLRIELLASPSSSSDMLQFFLQSIELDLLRAALSSIQSPLWESDDQGVVLWSNAAYKDLCDRIGADSASARLFDIAMPETAEPTRLRTSIADPARGSRCWFEVTSRQSNGTWLHHAVDIDAVVRAETAQRNFVQTLTKTFAHLPIGLAVFDRNRQLALFNPALIDLTSLPVDFLSGRPNLLSFFDHMRENRMMPEPKNYSGWREQMAELVAAASDDRYSETWSLPSGLTYKITGRPHPDGAIAFLIEDISAEISLTRRFRADMELSQSVLDSLDEAVVVFSHLGVLTMCNAAYRELWKSDPDSAFAEMTIVDATRHWQSCCAPSPIWGDLRDFVLDGHDRARWDAELSLTGGHRLICQVEPVVAGATLVRFAHQEAAILPDIPKLRLQAGA